MSKKWHVHVCMCVKCKWTKWCNTLKFEQEGENGTFQQCNIFLLYYKACCYHIGWHNNNQLQYICSLKSFISSPRLPRACACSMELSFFSHRKKKYFQNNFSDVSFFFFLPKPILAELHRQYSQRNRYLFSPSVLSVESIVLRARKHTGHCAHRGHLLFYYYYYFEFFKKKIQFPLP